jgi:hypothetical protein
MINEHRNTKSTADKAPENEYEALMRALPHHEPEELPEAIMDLRDAVASYFELLDPREQWILNACISEGKSLQEIGDELSFTKTHIWRLRNKAFEKLKELMSTDAIIRKSVKLADTWEQSATQWTMHLVSLAGTRDDSFMLTDKLDYHINTLAWLIEEKAIVDYQSEIEDIATTVINELRAREAWDTGQMVATLCSKQHDYGHGNINKFGLFGVLVRLSDKIERYKNLTNKHTEAINESIGDTLTDMVGYCIIALMLLDETFNLELGDDYGHHSGHN